MNTDFQKLDLLQAAMLQCCVWKSCFFTPSLGLATNHMALDTPSNLTPVVAGVFSLAGVWLGSFLSQRNNRLMAHRQRMSELRVRSYAKLMGLKLPMCQAVQSHAESRILCEFYDARYHIANDLADLEESKRQNNRSLELIPEITKLRRELFELLGEVQICYPRSQELTQAIDSVYASKAVDISEIRGKVTTIAALEGWKTQVIETLLQTVESEYASKIESLRTALYPLADKA